MTCTVRGYPSLQNYKDEVEKNPDALRPDCCPECKQPKLWLHGFYNRLIIRKDASRTIDEEAKILRFQCVQCEVSFIALMAPPNYRLKEPLFRCQKTSQTKVHFLTNFLLFQ